MDLHESVLLLGLDDEKGKLTGSTTSTYLYYGFAAALIMDLVLAGRVVIEEERVRLKTNAITDNPLLNEVLRRLQERKKPPKVITWIHSLMQWSGKLRPLAIERLIRQGILEEREEKILWVFNVNRYPSVNSEPENQLRDRLQEVLFAEAEPTPKERMLLGLVQASYLLKELIPDKARRRAAKERIEVLTAESEMRRLLGRAIQEMQAAVMVGVTAAI